MRNSVSKHFDPILEQDHQYDLYDTAQPVGGFQAGFLLLCTTKNLKKLQNTVLGRRLETQMGGISFKSSSQANFHTSAKTFTD